MKSYYWIFLCAIVVSCSPDDREPDNINSTEVFNECCSVQYTTAPPDSLDVFVPSSFTPNGDGVNDVFGVFVGANVSKVDSLVIFDSKKLIQETLLGATTMGKDTMIGGWNGFSSFGPELDDGLYSYFTYVYDSLDNRSAVAGYVCLRRDSLPDCDGVCIYGNQLDFDKPLNFDLMLPNGELFPCE